MVKKRRKNILNKLILLAFVCCFISCNAQENRYANNITLDQLKKNVIGKNTQLIDVRTPKEYRNGHIDNAININFFDKNTFLKKANQLNKQAPVYLYCHTGVRSKRASKIFRELGFKNIYDFSDGWKAWKKDQKIK